MTFGFLIFPEVEELDFVGPWEIVGTWGKFYGGPDPRLVDRRDRRADRVRQRACP